MQGTEHLDDLGLNLQDFGARQYDPFTWRTHIQDPHADSYAGISPYSFLNNSPINFIDLTGMDGGDPNDESGIEPDDPVLNDPTDEGAPQEGPSQNTNASGGSSNWDIDGGTWGTVTIVGQKDTSFDNFSAFADALDQQAQEGPTRDKGAFVGSDDFYGYMQNQAMTNPVEVVALILKGKNDKDYRYFVLPWKGNNGKNSATHIEEVSDFVAGYTKADVNSVVHTHPFGSEPSGADKIFSDAYKIPIYTIGPKGQDYVYFQGVIKPYSGM